MIGKWAKDKPPMLSVTAGKATIQAKRLTYSWSSGNRHTEADAMHPLDLGDELPVIKVPEDRIVTLSFETAPDQVTVWAWKASAAGTETYDRADLHLFISEKSTVILPLDDKYLYSVHASWEEQDGTGGDAYYGFASEAEEK